MHPEVDFMRYLAEGRFMIQRSRSSGRCVFYPRVAEPLTGARDLEWVEATGRGTVYSATTVRQRPPKQSYNVSLIDLAEGPRMLCRIDGIPPEEVDIGMAVEARIVTEEGSPMVVFVPSEPGDGR